jgi:DNA-binding transcriptional LysR family regulator
VQQELQAAEQSILDLAGDVGGKLRLATSHHIGLHRLPPMLSYFSKAYELIMQNKVELAIVTLAPTTEASIITVPVWQDPLDFMVHREHELLLQPTLDLQALSHHPAILPGLSTYTGQIVKSLFDTHGLQLQVSMATNYLETIRMMASVGLGWTVLPRSMQDSSLATLKINDARIERTLGIIYHRGRSLSRAALAFIHSLENFGDAGITGT